MTAQSPQRSVFVAGAGGAIGEVLCRLLVADGWRVTGTTRSAGRASRLRDIGVAPVVVDVFDREALLRAVRDASPQVVVHQLTDLPRELTPEALAAGRIRNARLREVGTSNLVAGAVEAGATRMVAQSIAFAYAPGPRPFAETAPLDAAAQPAVVKLEALVLGSGLEALVLRYGHLYGPRTWTMTPPPDGPVHVEAAAQAARLAMTRGESGAYNIAEDDGTVSSDKARRELGWSPAFRVEAPEP